MPGNLFLVLRHCGISPETGQIFMQLLSANQATDNDGGLTGVIVFIVHIAIGFLIFVRGLL